MSGNIQKVAAVTVKPYELVPRVDDKGDKIETENVEDNGKKHNEVIERDEGMEKIDIAKDAIGAKYMKMEQSVFSWKMQYLW